LEVGYGRDAAAGGPKSSCGTVPNSAGRRK
jgi:hypothetical protein